MALKTTNVAPGLRRNQPYKGRGASLNLEGRYEKWQRECFDDGWDEQEDEPESRAPKTIVIHEQAKSIINPVNSPDIPFRYRSIPTAAVNMAVSTASRDQRIHTSVYRQGWILKRVFLPR